MPASQPLPEGFAGTSFDRASFAAAGGRSGRLRNRDVLRPFHGVQTTALPESLLDRCRASAVRLRPGQSFSHVTAARLLEFPLPGELEALDDLDVSAVMPAEAPRTRGVRGHRLRVPPRVIEHRGLPIAAAPETWCRIAPLLRGDDLIVAADHVLLLWPDQPDRVRALLLEAIRRPGRVERPRLLAVLGEARPDCRSPGETRARLPLCRSGLPEPVLNARMTTDDGVFLGSPDLAWPSRRVGLEYEGEHHFADRRQYRYDVVRYARFGDAGWTIVRAIDDDLRGAGADRLVADAATPRLVMTATSSTTARSQKMPLGPRQDGECCEPDALRPQS